jgi:hypothetical protein
MRVWSLVCVCGLLGALGGCKQGGEAASASAPPLIIKGVLLEPGEQAPGVEGLPEAEALKAELSGALRARSAWELKEGDAQGTHMRLAYVYQQVQTPERAVLLLLLEGSMGTARTERGESLPLACDRVVGDPPDAAKRSSAGELMTRGIKECLDDLEAALGVDRAADAELPALLLKADLPRAAALRALIRVREGKQREALPGVRKQLAGEDRQVVLSAASAAAAMGDRESAAAMVAAAEQLSRAHAWPELVAMLTQLGDLGGEEATRYLSVVAEGHEQAEVQRVAAMALERAKGRP